MELLNSLKTDLTLACVFLVLYIIVFIAAKWAKDLFTPYSLNQELAEKDNFSVALTMVGYYLAITLVFVALLKGPTVNLRSDLLNVAGYSLLGILLLNGSRWINDKFILRAFCNIKKLTEEQDAGVGAVQFGVYTATGLIISGAVTGEGGWLTFLVFFALGQLMLIISSIIYQQLSVFDIHSEVASNNTAVGVAFGGSLIALGLILMNGVAGDFIDWKQDLSSFAISAFSGLILLPLLQLILDRLVIPGKSLRKEIAEDRNLGAGLLEAGIAISFALVLIQLV
jgi:uncharacterized membrane protein YjfL (UPF0719 family)